MVAILTASCVQAMLHLLAMLQPSALTSEGNILHGRTPGAYFKRQCLLWQPAHHVNVASAETHAPTHVICQWQLVSKLSQRHASADPLASCYL